MINTKENKAGEQQPYIPSGHGERSGEYTYKNSSNYAIEENCTFFELEKFLTSKELSCLISYSQPEIGINLNKNIRNNQLSNEEMEMKAAIISAIKKHNLKKEVTVFRGIKISSDLYSELFYNRYMYNLPIKGSVICSTSRDINRAKKAAYSTNKNMVSIVFQANLPKGYNALPIEDISIDPSEQEILINEPIYRIKSLELCVERDWQYVKIKIYLGR